MSYITITTEKNETYSSISNFFIDYYMTSASGEFVKVYLYLVRQLSSREPISVAEIADHFNLTEKDICRAIKYWISQDVMRLNYNDKKEPVGITLLPLQDKSHQKSDSMDGLSLLSMDYMVEDNSPAAIAASATTQAASVQTAPVQADTQNISAATDISAVPAHALPLKAAVTPEILRKKQEDGILSDLIFETEAYFGRPLSMPETESLIYIYDQLDFSQELIEYLIEYCLTMGKASFRYAETVAASWYEKGIDTVEKAKSDSNAYNPFYRKVFSELGIRRGNPTSIESAYIDAWSNEMNFSEDLILLACQKAILSKPQSANFAYVNGILENWHKNGVKSLRDVQQLDLDFMKKKTDNTVKNQAAAARNPNGFANFKQTDMSDQLGQLEQMLADELNLNKKSS
jgi:DnaD/phage-associated family protein